jgi:hypothetical protein
MLLLPFWRTLPGLQVQWPLERGRRCVEVLGKMCSMLARGEGLPESNSTLLWTTVTLWYMYG